MVELRFVAARWQATLDAKPFHESLLPDGTQWTAFYRMHANYLLRFPELADFEVSAGGNIVTCSPAPEVSDATIQHLYLNQVLPLALNKLGKLVFHASAVEVQDSAIAFVAQSGRGKSTLAASFAINGSRFLTDDGLVLELGDQDYQVVPIHPSVRLWQDSQEMLAGQDAITAPPVHFTSKVRFLAGAGLPYCNQPRPLWRTYFLADGGAREITFSRLSAPEALVKWVKHSFLLDVEDRSLVGSHFDQVSKLANKVTCYQLDYPRRFEDLDHIRQAIVEHAILGGVTEHELDRQDNRRTTCVGQAGGRRNGDP